MRNAELLVLDYEHHLKLKIANLNNLILSGCATHTVKKEHRIHSEMLGEFRKIAYPYLERSYIAKLKEKNT
jgi:hypothetical protein